MSTFAEVSSIKEKLVRVPDKPLSDRAFIRYDCDNQSFADGEFNQLRFKVDAPSSRSIFRNVRVVLPMSFKFKTRQGKSVYRAGIAPKANDLGRIFRSVEININGQSYMQSPLEKLVHRYVSSSTSLKFEPDGGSMLPILPKDDVAIAYHNYSFEQRCKEFAQSWNPGTQSYEFDLEIFLDGGPLSAFIRGQEANGNLAVPYCYNMDITVQFDQSYGKTDTQNVQGRLGQTCWKHCFDIQQPCSKLAVERSGFKPSRPHLRTKDVARVLVLDDDLREVEIRNGNHFTDPQPGHEFRTGQGVGGIPAQGGNAHIYIKGKNLYDKVEKWLSEGNNIQVPNVANHLFDEVNSTDGAFNQARRYYVGWFRVGYSENGAVTLHQTPAEGRNSTRIASYLDSQMPGVDDETRQDQDPSSFSLDLEHGLHRALAVAYITKTKGANNFDPRINNGDVVADLEILDIGLSTPATPPVGNVFGIAGITAIVGGRRRFDRQVAHQNGYRFCLMEAPVAPVVSGNVQLVARGLSAHEDRGPNYEISVKDYNANTRQAVARRYTMPKGDKIGLTSLRIFQDDDTTEEKWEAGNRENRLDSAGNPIAGQGAASHKRTNIGACANDWYKTWYFSDSVVRYGNSGGGSIKLNGIHDRRFKNVEQEFMIWANKKEQAQFDESDELVVIAQEPEQPVGVSSDTGFVNSLVTNVNVNGIYKPTRIPFGLLCPYSNATRGLQGNWIKGDQNYVSGFAPHGAVGAVALTEQEDFRCGDVTIIPYREPEPFFAIDATYQWGRRPHVSCEVVLHENMKRQYMLDDYRMERHRFPEPLRIQDIVSGKRIFFSDLRINEVPSCVYLLACIDPEQLDLELCTSGLSDCLLSTLKTRIQVNNTIAFDFTDKAQEYSLYEMFARACPQANISYQCFKDRRPLLAFKPEELAIDEFQAGRFQISNLNVETMLELSPSWRRILQRAGTAKSHLATSPDQGTDFWKTYEASNKLLPYFLDLPVRVELVVEYSNYMLQVDDAGKTTRVLNRLPAIGESGFEFRNPRPATQTMTTPGFVELGK